MDFFVYWFVQGVIIATFNSFDKPWQSSLWIWIGVWLFAFVDCLYKIRTAVLPQLLLLQSSQTLLFMPPNKVFDRALELRRFGREEPLLREMDQIPETARCVQKGMRIKRIVIFPSQFWHKRRVSLSEEIDGDVKVFYQGSEVSTPSRNFWKFLKMGE